LIEQITDSIYHYIDKFVHEQGIDLCNMFYCIYV